MPLETQAKILRVLVDQNFQRVGGVDARPGRRARHLLDQPRSAQEIADGPLPRGPVPPPERRADPRARRSPSGARTSPSWSTISWSRSAQAIGPAAAPDRRRRHGGAAVARLAGQRPPAAQQRRAAADPGRGRARRGRSPPTCCRPRSARWCQPMPERRRRRAADAPAAARGARDFRARISDRPDQPLRRQHLAHRRVHRHGALGPAPQAEVARRRPASRRDGRGR